MLESADAYEQYIVDRHVPDLLATGCFERATVLRSDNRFQMRYHAASEADLQRYLDEHAAALRQDALDHFPMGIVAKRSVWRSVGRFEK